MHPGDGTMSTVTGALLSEPEAVEPDTGPLPETAHRRFQTLLTRPTTALLTATVVGAAVVFWLMHRALIDDAYITLSYARTLAEHGQWGLLPDHPANTATSPLNVMLLGAVTVILGDPLRALGVVYVANAVALAWGLRGLGRALGLGLRPAVIGTPLLVLNPLLASTLGLETGLAVTTIVYLAWASMTGQPTAYGVAAGVLMLLRLDLSLIVVAMFVLSPRLWHRAGRVAAVAAGLLLPWLVFSWVVLGSAIPDTLLIKQDSGRAGTMTAVDLLARLFAPFTFAVTATLLVAAAGVLAVATLRLWGGPGVSGAGRLLPALGLAAAAYFAGIWALHVPAFFWYLGPPLACLTLCAVLALAALSHSVISDGARWAVRLLVAAMGVTTLLPWFVTAEHRTPFQAAPLHGNWAMPGQYAKIGHQLPRLTDGAPVHSPGEVGALAYFCECTLVDRFSDRGQLRSAIGEQIEESWLYRLNYHWLDVGDLRRVPVQYRLNWQPGRDPGGRQWPATTPPGYPRVPGHFVLRYVGEQSANRLPPGIT